MASPTQWTWVWLDSGGWWWTGRPGVLCSMKSQRFWHNWVTELKWTELKILKSWQGFWVAAEVMCHTWAGRRWNIALTFHLYWDWLQIWESAHEKWSSCRGLALSKTFFISASQSLLFSNLTILPNHTSYSFFLLSGFWLLSQSFSPTVLITQMVSLFSQALKVQGSFAYYGKGR